MSDSAPMVNIISDDLVQTPWAVFHRMRADVTEADGTMFTDSRDFLDRGNAVALLPFCRERASILLVRQFRLPVFQNDPRDSMLLEVCGGILQDSNSEAEALREAQEELGITLSDLRRVFSAYSSPGSLTEKIDYFVANYALGQRIPAFAGNHDEGERIEVLEVPLRDTVHMIAAGTICDLRTISLLFFLLHEIATAPA